VIEYVLDTNACIALINGTSIPVRREFTRALAEGSVVCVSSVAVHELWYGVSKSARLEANTARVQTFLGGPMEVLEFDDADARAAGALRAELERTGQSIGAYDTMIAAQAVRRGITLVTADTKDFARVDGLMWEDWSRARARR